MDFKESKFKEEVGNFMINLQKLLPKKKDIAIILRPDVTVLTRLSDVHAEAKNVFPKCFVGAKLVIFKEMMDKVKLVQHYTFGKSKDAHKCFSQIIHKEMETTKAEDGLVVDLAGSATATYRESLEDDLEIRVTSKIKDFVSSEVEAVLEKNTQKWIGSSSFCVKDVDPSTLRLVAQFMYKVMPDYSVGVEAGVKTSTLATKLSISSRYERPSFTLSSTVSNCGIQLCLYKQFSRDLRIATIVNHSASTTLSLALHKNYQNGSELKMFVDSQRCGGFTFEKDILFSEPEAEMRVIRLLASTLIDRQRRVRFGFGFHLDF
ncbi:unnamed protein product [Leptosia nina]|uniref:Uncharacterized protein n=1 Tax=Leptosia nina TaxID=320188 RepID=A0AAV1JN91_9NEOP